MMADAPKGRSAIDEVSGSLTGVYGRDYLEDLRSDWPT